MKRRELIRIIEAQREAAQAVIDCWEQGNLAGAVGNLEGTFDEADKALKWWKSED